MRIATETVTTDPVTYAASATQELASEGCTIQYYYSGQEGESRAQCKLAARKGLEAKLIKLSREGKL